MSLFPLLTPNPQNHSTTSTHSPSPISAQAFDRQSHTQQPESASGSFVPKKMPSSDLKSAFEAVCRDASLEDSETRKKEEAVSLVEPDTAETSASTRTVSPNRSLSAASASPQRRTIRHTLVNQLFIPPSDQPIKALPQPSSHLPLVPTPNPLRSNHISGWKPKSTTDPSLLTESQLMPPPPLPSRLTDRSKTTNLGKRKYQPCEHSNHSTLVDDKEDQPSITAPSSRQRREISIITNRNPAEPIPILPTPIPSARFKKHQTSRQVLIPVEQLPVFALPPLPVIPNEGLLKQVFTHQSLFELGRGRFEESEDEPAGHYEKLEHVGDSILGMVVTTWLHEIRPNLTCGTATRLKAHLVSNATLSHLSGLYNLPQRLNGDPDLLPVLRAQTDVRAALVEAYIAALYFSYPVSDRMSVALPIIDAWLREMYDPLQDFFYTYMKTEYDQYNAAAGADDEGNIILLPPAEMSRIDKASQGMHTFLQMYCNTHERKLRYDEEKYDTSLGLLWKMTVLVDGIELGEGTRATRKVAKNVAAWEAAKKLGLTADSTPAGGALF